MLILHKPGSVVKRTLSYETAPGKRQELPGVVINFVVPDTETGREIFRWSEKLDKDEGASITEAAKVMIGLLVRKIDGVKFQDGSNLELQKDDNGHLTDDTIADIWKLLTPLLQASIEFVQLSPQDLGNSHVPQPTKQDS